MKLRTKIEVQHTVPNKPAGVVTGIVEGHIENTAWLNGFSTLGANYIYATAPDENGNATIIAKSGLILTADETEALYQAVKDSVPADLTYAQEQEYLTMLGFASKMAETFGITVDDIEIV